MVERPLYMNKIDNFIDMNIIKIITGIRRSGKSYFFKLIIEKLIERGINRDNILLIDLELPKYNNIQTKEELDDIVLDFIKNQENKVYLLIDEIQNIENWEIAINSYYKMSNIDIYIIGSNSKLLSKELSTFLTGRYVSIEIYPFSFNEFLDYKKELREKPFIENELNSNIENYFEEYLSYGGLPLTIAFKDYKNIILKDLYSSIILNDIVNRYEIRNIGLFNRIIKYVIQNIGNLISANSIFKYLKHDNLKISKNTVYDY